MYIYFEEQEEYERGASKGSWSSFMTQLSGQKSQVCLQVGNQTHSLPTGVLILPQCSVQTHNLSRFWQQCGKSVFIHMVTFH